MSLQEAIMPGDPWWYGTMGILPGTETIPLGVRTGHTWHEMGTMLRLVDLYQVSTFVEIGVHEGGLASLLALRALAHPDFHYLGVELNEALIVPTTRRMLSLFPDANLHIGDAFSEAARGRAAGFVRRATAGRAIVYCDGGDKAEEIRFYKDVPKAGDLLMAHDFWDGVSEVRDVPGYGSRLFPKPEVVVGDLAVLLDGYNPLPAAYLAATRIVGFIRRQL